MVATTYQPSGRSSSIAARASSPYGSRRGACRVSRKAGRRSLSKTDAVSAGTRSLATPLTTRTAIRSSGGTTNGALGTGSA